MSMFTSYSAPFVSICLLCSQAQGSVPAPAHSPEAHTDLICHTSHASECYPAIFQPTEQFQRIHDDQSIPPGLHVRLNLATGLKEARLNIPEPDDAPKADLVLIDSPPSPIAEEQPPLTPHTPAHNQNPLHPSYEDDLKGPSPFLPSEDIDKFIYYQQNAANLFNPSTNSEEILESLSDLTEYAHSQEWGRAITSDTTLARIFVNLLDSESLTPVKVQSAAAQLLGTAIQNNPEALDALLAHFTESNAPETKPMQIVCVALERSTAANPTIENYISQKRLLFLLSQLCHDPPQDQLRLFASESGLHTLLKVFAAESIKPGDGRDVVRTKVANFMVDQIIPAMARWQDRPLYKDEVEITGWEESMLSKEDSGGLLEIRTERAEEKQWCEAFETAIERYDAGFEEQSNQALEAYQSIVEAHELLGQVVAVDGCERGCKCDIEKKIEE